MDLLRAIRTRRSIRAFRADPVSAERIEPLVDLANLAPSAGNLQARDFVVVSDEAMRKSLAATTFDQAFIADAPVVVVVCANLQRIGKYGPRGRDLYALQDAAAATENLLLAAHAEGLGSVWIGAFDEGAVVRLLDLPRHVRPVALLPIGEPAEDPAAPERLPLSEILHWDRW